MYEFSNKWFDINAKNNWSKFFDEEKPARFLEIGSYEGASACFIIDNPQQEKIELHCIDPWGEGLKFPSRAEYEDMRAKEDRFKRNIQLALSNSTAVVNFNLHKGVSSEKMSSLIATGYKDYFDWVYIDGSHEAADVLSDAVQAYTLTRAGGIIAFDDYTWRFPTNQPDILESPKIAIDAFVNIYFKKVQVIPRWLTQLYVRKL